MSEFHLIAIFLFVLFLLLGTGVWVGLALLGVAFVAKSQGLDSDASFALVAGMTGAAVAATSSKSRCCQA